MRKAHGNSLIPRVGSDAVDPQLGNVKSLVSHRHHKFNLREICDAIGYFAIGHDRRMDIFLGDLHNSFHHQQQVGLCHEQKVDHVTASVAFCDLHNHLLYNIYMQSCTSSRSVS